MKLLLPSAWAVRASATTDGAHIPDATLTNASASVPSDAESKRNPAPSKPSWATSRGWPVRAPSWDTQSETGPYHFGGDRQEQDDDDMRSVCSVRVSGRWARSRKRLPRKRTYDQVQDPTHAPQKRTSQETDASPRPDVAQSIEAPHHPPSSPPP
jgi:hypothetical protein